jgi:ferric-dicitrate binding protein FerR (iron transport regulator)
MTHDEWQDLLAPYVLGALPAPEQARVRGHLSACPDCRRALEAMGAAALALPFSAPPQTPPDQVKARLMERVQRSRSFPWTRVLALAASVAVVIGLAGLWRNRRPAPVELVRATGPVLADGRRVNAGGSVRTGQRLVVPDGAEADFLFASRIAFRLSPGSEAVAVRNGSGLEIQLKHGGVLNVVKPGTRFSVKSPLVQAQALGTVFYVRAQPETAYICLCAGRIDLEAPGFVQSLSADTHSALYVMPGPSGAETKPGPMVYHTDQDIRSLSTRLP